MPELTQGTLSQEGQAILELTLSSALLALTLAGAGWLLKAEWNRGKCAYLVFEATHARLTGSPLSPSRVEVVFDESPLQVSGTGRCGGAIERVSFTRLEVAEW